jgi:hypothetical protein
MLQRLCPPRQHHGSRAREAVLAAAGDTMATRVTNGPTTHAAQ